MKKLTLILIGILAAALLFGGCKLLPQPAAAETPAAATAPEAESDDNALDFSLTTLTGGTLDNTVFSDHKLVMVNYWATWCGPCVGEIPDLVKIQSAYSDQSFTIVGVLTGDDDIDGATQFLSDEKVNYPVVMPEAFFLDKAAGISAIPTTMFFDSEGKQVGETIVGAKSYDDWSGLIKLLLERVG